MLGPQVSFHRLVGSFIKVKILSGANSTGTSTRTTLKKRPSEQFGLTHTMIPNTSNPYPTLTLPIQTPKRRKKDENRSVKPPSHPPNDGRQAVAIMAKATYLLLTKTSPDLACPVGQP